MPELKSKVTAIKFGDHYCQIYFKLLIIICSIFYPDNYLVAETTGTKTLAQPNRNEEAEKVERVRSLPVKGASSLVAQRVTRIIGVKLKPTDSGLEVILKTVAGSQKLVPLILPEGNNLAIDILDATLALPDAETFTATNPTKGITEVTVKPVDATSIRITIRGEKVVPSAEVLPSQDNLVLSVTPKAANQTETASEIEVLVTAEKRPDRPQDVPISLRVFGQEELEDTQVNSLNDIANNTPNFFSTAGDRYFNFYSIRGLGNGNFLSRDSVGVFVDDVPYENALSFAG